MDRASVDTDTLVRVVLVLVVVWLGLELLEELFDVLAWLLGPLQPLLGLALIVLLVLYLTDRL